MEAFESTKHDYSWMQPTSASSYPIIMQVQSRGEGIDNVPTSTTKDGVETVPVTVVRDPVSFVATYGGSAAIQVVVWLMVGFIASKMFGLGKFKDSLINWMASGVVTHKMQQQLFVDIRNDIKIISEAIQNTSKDMDEVKELAKDGVSKVDIILDRTREK